MAENTTTQEQPSTESFEGSSFEIFLDSLRFFLGQLFNFMRHVFNLLEHILADFCAMLVQVLGLNRSTLPPVVLQKGSDLTTVESLALNLKNRKNFASKDSGATVLWKSDGITNPKAILSANKEEYLILPECKEEQEYVLIVNLSEDVAVDTIVISNHEDFSDLLSSIEYQGSIDYPPERWLDLGQIVPLAGSHEHVLSVELKKS